MKMDFIITEKETLPRQDETVTMTQPKQLFHGQAAVGVVIHTAKTNRKSYYGIREEVEELSSNTLDRKDIGMDKDYGGDDDDDDEDDDSILVDTIELPDLNSVTDHSSYSTLDAGDISPNNSSIEMNNKKQEQNVPSFFAFRLSYLFVTLVVMLADGLQGMYYKINYR